MGSFSRLTLDEMIERICRVLREKDAPTTPAYSLILGAGASAGVVPMTQELVTERIPDWLFHLDEEELPPALRSTIYPTVDKAQLKSRAQYFWRSFYLRNKDRKDAYGENIALFSLDEDGLPDDSGGAYRAVFHREALGGFEDLARMRRFFRQLTMGKDGKVKLNGTHFYLASLLALQPRGNSNHEPTERYKARRPFARTIITTNFDPLLQVSLQLVSLLYYTIDQPDLLQFDLTGEAEHSAIQLVHVHGSIHRPFLANTKSELDSMRDRHAASLASFLGQHGVIVIGSGGWEDCLTVALQRCQNFPHGLYWLGRDEKTLPKTFVKFLEQHAGDAFFVKITDASDFMSRLYSALAPSLRLPELLVEPLVLLRREMEKIDLSNASPAPTAGNNIDISVKSESTVSVADITPSEVLLKNLGLLQNAHEHYFARQSDSVVQAQTEAIADGLAPEAVSQLLRQADLRYSGDDYTKALGIYDALIESKLLSGQDLSIAIFRRGYCHGETGQIALAIKDYTSVINISDAPPDQRLKAFLNRGNFAEETSKAIEDYTAAIETPDASPDLRAQAFYNRGVSFGSSNEESKAIEDYTNAIEIAGISTEIRTLALLNRGGCYEKINESNKAILDYSAIIDMPEVSPDNRAKALLNRGTSYWKVKESAKAIEDYTTVTKMPDSSPDHRTKGFFNCGVFHGHADEITKAIEYYTAAIDMLGASPSMRAAALVNRGASYGNAKEMAKAIVDYTTVINMLDSPLDQRAKALINRGKLLYQEAKKGEAKKDFEAVLMIRDLPENLFKLAQSQLDTLNF